MADKRAKDAKNNSEAAEDKKDVKAAGESKEATTTKPKKTWADVEKKEKRRKQVRGFLIGLFSVFIALSMMLPSLSYIVMGMQSSDSSSTSTETEQQLPQSLDDLEATYQPMVDSLLKTLEEKPNDPDALRNLGSYYMSWAYQGSSFAVDEESSKTVNNLYQKALEYYDKYLALEDIEEADRNSVRASRASCQYYAGDREGGVEAMRQLTTDAPDYPVGWIDLAFLLQSNGETEEAKKAYQKAIETDPEDKEGVKSYAEQQLAALEEAEKAAEKAASEDAKDEANKDADAEKTDDADAEKTDAEATDAADTKDADADTDASAKTE